MFQIKSKFPLDKVFIVLFFWLAQWGYHELSVKKAIVDYPYAIQSSNFYRSADQYSYYQPARNFLDDGTWKDNSPERSSFYRRSPGYGMFMLPFLAVSTHHEPGIILLHAQFIIQALLVLLFYLTLLTSFKKTTSIVASIVIGFWWLGINMSGHILTEAITPTLGLAVLVISYFKNGINRWSSLLLALLILVKPIFLLLLFAFWISNSILRQQKWRKLFVYSIIVLIPTMLWEIRNQFHEKPLNSLTQVLHPVYDPGNADIWRLPHEALYGLVKLSDPNPEHFHKWVENFTQQKEFTPSLCDFLGDEITNQIGAENLEIWERDYFESLGDINLYASHGTYGYKEEELAMKMNTYADTFARENLLKVYVFNPLKIAGKSFSHSYLSGPYFWDSEYNLTKKIWSYFSVLLALISFVSLLLGPLSMKSRLFPLLVKQKTTVLTTSIFGASYLFYLFWIQRGIEMRYLTPLLPLGILNAVIISSSLAKSRLTSDVISSDE